MIRHHRTHLRKVSRNAGNPHTFGKWEKVAGNGNADTGATEDPGRLRTFGRWAENAGKLRTFRRWDEAAGNKNAGKLHTFGRWEKAAGNGNAGTGATEGPARLRTFGR